MDTTQKKQLPNKPKIIKDQESDSLYVMVKKSDGTTVRMPVSNLSRRRNLVRKRLKPKPLDRSSNSSTTFIKPKPAVQPLSVQSKVSNSVIHDKVENSNVDSNIRTKRVISDEMDKALRNHSVSHKPLKKNNDAALMVSETHALSTTSPVTDIFVDEAMAHNKPLVKNVTSTPKRTGSIPLSAIPMSASSDKWVPRHMEKKSVTGKRPVVRDLKPPPAIITKTKSDYSSVGSKMTIGPVDEISQLSLTVLRKFVSDPEDYRQHIIDKFVILQTDSYILYLQAIDAWHRSPLWGVYSQVILDSLFEDLNVDKLLSDPDRSYDGMTMKDFVSMTQVNMFLQI